MQVSKKKMGSTTSVIFSNRWKLFDKHGKVLKEVSGKLIEHNGQQYFKFENGSILDMNHVFVELTK